MSSPARHPGRQYLRPARNLLTSHAAPARHPFVARGPDRRPCPRTRPKACNGGHANHISGHRDDTPARPLRHRPEPVPRHGPHGPGRVRHHRSERPGRPLPRPDRGDPVQPEVTSGAAPAAGRRDQPESRPPDAITVAGLRKSYGSVHAVRNVSFSVSRSEIVALLGPNGAGKTTTLEILEGFRARDGGAVAVLGLDPGDKSAAPELRERTGLVLQDIAVEPYLTVRETIARQAGYYQAPRAVPEVIGLVGLTGLERRKVRSLSGGQKRRLDLALGLIGGPELLFLDEPTTGFDPSARRDAWQIVRNLRGSGTTILLTTHYMEEAQALADRVALISGGQIVAEGPPSAIGGRDTARARIRFALPPACSVADLPLPASVAPDGLVTVDRPSLEDVYLRLTAGHAAPDLVTRSTR